MTAANDDDVESAEHRSVLAEADTRVKSRHDRNVSRETCPDCGIYGSLSDTEVPEDHVQDVLNVDAPGKPAESLGRKAQLFG